MLLTSHLFYTQNKVLFFLNSSTAITAILTMSAISIPKGQIKLAGIIHKSATASASSKSPALVIVHLGGGVKEQTAGLYAKRISEAGFTTVTYDASNQGESGGEPHFLEDPSQRVSDVWSVVDYLECLDFVDSDKIVDTIPRISKAQV